MPTKWNPRCLDMTATAFQIFLLLNVYIRCCWTLPDNDVTSNTTNVAEVYEPDVVRCHRIYGDIKEGPPCRQALGKISIPGRLPRSFTFVRQKKVSSPTTLQVPVQWKDDDGSSKMFNTSHSHSVMSRLTYAQSQRILLAS